MATNGSGTSVSIRDERGRYLKGIAVHAAVNESVELVRAALAD